MTAVSLGMPQAPVLQRRVDQIPPSFWLTLAGGALILLAAHAEAIHEGAVIYDLVHPYERRWI